MNKSRLVVLASTLIVGAGALTAVGALYLDPARAAVGPLPAEGLALPADAQFVMGIDVRRFVASPFYTRFGEEHAQARPAGLRGDGGEDRHQPRARRGRDLHRGPQGRRQAAATATAS